jgi:hypothetical protein
MQLTGISYNGTLRHAYRYSATASDGKITSYKNWQSGEDVQYQYDITSILPAKRSALATYCHAPLAGLRTLCGAGRLTSAAAVGRSGCSRTGTTGGAMCC